uniref:Glutamyl/glutaminyl-tRNA synthetase class Ib anti-codon binding domain-containing protein n=1 Tax=Grammatophora oceanica TaxID=210454 RepID=A0A7S1VDS4_9STRA
MAEGWPKTYDIQNSPTDPSLGSHTLSLEGPILYIDASDFRLEDHSTYYGLAPNKAVGLKYHGGNMICDKVIKEGEKVVALECHLDISGDRPKPKTYISWVPLEGCVHAEVRVYNDLFSVAEPTDLWEEELNPTSEIVYKDAKLDASVREVVQGGEAVDRWTSNLALQFERIGYFVVDYESHGYDPTTNTGLLVFNRTVSLKEEVFKKELTPAELAAIEARREQSKKDKANKEARMKLDPLSLFKEGEEYKGKYSKYNEETGVPTHAANGEPLSKSAMKKLEKDRKKFLNQKAKWEKANK